MNVVIGSGVEGGVVKSDQHIYELHNSYNWTIL